MKLYEVNTIIIISILQIRLSNLPGQEWTRNLLVGWLLISHLKGSEVRVESKAEVKVSTCLLWTAERCSHCTLNQEGRHTEHLGSLGKLHLEPFQQGHREHFVCMEQCHPPTGLMEQIFPNTAQNEPNERVIEFLIQVFWAIHRKSRSCINLVWCC